MYIYTENHTLQVNTIIAPKTPHSIEVFYGAFHLCTATFVHAPNWPEEEKKWKYSGSKKTSCSRSLLSRKWLKPQAISAFFCRNFIANWISLNSFGGLSKRIFGIIAIIRLTLSNKTCQRHCLWWTLSQFVDGSTGCSAGWRLIAQDFKPKMHRYRSRNSPPQSTNHIDAFWNVPHRLLMAREGVVYLCAKLGPDKIKILLNFEN